jgi:hypothetical protein
MENIIYNKKPQGFRAKESLINHFKYYPKQWTSSIRVNVASF